MLDSDLATLYRVETKRLNEQVKRNLKRFPGDFMFKLTSDEFEVLRSQIATSKEGKGGRRYQPLVFTENGIEVNIAIMRVFTKLRSFYALEDRVERKVESLEQKVTQVFKVVFERLDNLEEVVINQKKRKKIGLKS